jgi:hypothetical protein
MEPHDFWNLAGRAGRWGDEFQGNIICIDSHDEKAWPIGVPSRARHPIKRESDADIEQTDGLLDYLERRATTSLSELEDTDEYEQVGAYLLTTFLRLGTIARSSLIERHGSDTVEKIDQRLATLASHIEIKPEIAARHPGVSALGMQHLLEAFRGYEKAVENLLPATISSPDSYDRLVTIMQRINKHLFPAFSPDGSTKYYALVVVQWLKGYSLAAMIRSRIDHNKRQGKSYKLPALIRSTMEDVEQIARFRAPKYLSAYIDILRIHLQAIGKQDLIEHDLDVGTQLEFGVSSRSLLSLMELGLSRMGAVSLYEKMARDDLSKEECLTWVAERDALLEGMDIPAIVVREVREKLVKAR